MVLAVAYGGLRGWQGRQPPTPLPGQTRWAAPGPFVEGMQRFAVDAPGPCDDAEVGRRIEARARYALDNAVPGADRQRKLAWSTPSLLLGDERGLAAVYVPCRGFYWMTPDAVARGRLPDEP